MLLRPLELLFLDVLRMQPRVDQLLVDIALLSFDHLVQVSNRLRRQVSAVSEPPGKFLFFLFLISLLQFPLPLLFLIPFSLRLFALELIEIKVASLTR